MIHTTPDFFNKLVNDLDKVYFPKVKYYMDDADCAKVHHTTELFSNGCITYRQLIGRLSKACKDTTSNIHLIVEKHVISFGGYKYKPSK